MQSRVIQYLLQHGFKANYKGFHYLACILGIAIEAKSRMSMGELYVEAAKKCGVSWQCIESGVRNMIESYWKETKKSMYKPTNSECIAKMVTILKISKTDTLNKFDE